MNKAAIQRFAIQARTDLIDQVSQRAYQYGITKDGYGEANAVTVGGRALNTDEQRQRKELVEQIRQKGYTQVMEEVAYTWFNRFIALRFMEVNNYLPSHIRIFSDSTGAFKPEILNDALHLDMPGLNMDKVAEYIEKNQTEDLYRYLLLTQCNALNASLPQMFERMGGFTELLLPNNILKQDSVLGHMVTDIPEEDWTDQVQIIGWLYQYYNTELKAKADTDVKNGQKITGDNLPEKTQIFTPDWIVRYMVENSLGKLWIEGHPDDELKADWKYFLDEAEQKADVQKQLEAIRVEYRNISPQEIKVIDPCMGSGHILVYAFDVLVQIYKKCGISERDAAQSILENNLYGLDIDDRAAQLAYFAVMMKARQYDRRIFSRGIQPHIYAIVESNGLDRSTIDYFTNNDPELIKNFGTLVDELRDAKEYGSILNISRVDFAALYARIDEVRDDISIFREVVLSSYLPVIQVAEVMAQKYDVVVTNPPYLGLRSIGAKTLDYVQKYYPDSKNDFFSVFIERAIAMTNKRGKSSLVTAESWLSLSSFEKMRMKLLDCTTIESMVHLGENAFDAGFGTVAFVLRKAPISDYYGKYYRVTELETSEEKELAVLHRDEKCSYVANQKDFAFIPGSAVSYWVSPKLFDTFVSYTPLGDIAEPRQGLTTCDNDRFMRFWHEVELNNIGFNCSSTKESEALPQKWYPYNKGGEPRKWYGNNEYVVNWHNDGSEVKAFVASKYVSYTRTVKNIPYYFKKGLTWSAIAKKYAVRAYNEGFIFADKGQAVFADESKYYYLCGLMNSKYADAILAIISPTLDFNCGYIKKIPIAYNESFKDDISTIVKENIALSKSEWDMYETSWDFVSHPLVPLTSVKLEQEQSQFVSSRMEKFVHLSWHFAKWQQECDARFIQLKANEEELNRIFIEIYGLQDELTPEVEDKDVTVRKADLGRDIRSLIAYAVGCMFGRYSLDEPGLAYAGGEWDASKYSTIIPDKDNIIPICDDDYFDDDITGRFVKWVETVYGSETLEENLKFIADALGGKGTPREVIRSYFINDFYADHLKIYQKRPIYWLFDSGKKNGFKALIYMHRYQSDLLARMRTDYVHEQQERYRTQLMHIADAIDHASASERVKLTKQQKKLQEQSLEIQKYEEKIHHLADQNIQIDFDDGVKHNYEIFSDVLAKIK
ncbi:BREX-1 system adenine-specific DNA-methyltransferase PglX [Proteiniclasticum sp. QWL-01]|uniref:BREX-1 system adenine-specific DNA-methyltransferase PglX n=1 Tax=Proteiniclasticum sp. QWL-01 TaxID=3036945 RepID=UPI00241171A7|nr:BREX-1 system adenine-specific DNA-methyltransferase PglX [Proteiniclasticum sp. QWL-01]WFF73564.1 BREX-1 system adenine-specific DNA-methyltransferase PglX [Proteiniclasticum sp. QWL-01]